MLLKKDRYLILKFSHKQKYETFSISCYHVIQRETEGQNEFHPLRLYFLLQFFCSLSAFQYSWRLARNVTIILRLMLMFCSRYNSSKNQHEFGGHSSVLFQWKIPNLDSQSVSLEKDYSDKCTAVFTKTCFISLTHTFNQYIRLLWSKVQ